MLTLLQRVVVNHVTSVAPRFDSLVPKPDRAAVVRMLIEAPVPVPKFDRPVLQCQAPGRLLCSRWMFRWRGRCGKQFHTWTLGKGCLTWALWMQSFQLGSMTCLGSLCLGSHKSSCLVRLVRRRQHHLPLRWLVLQGSGQPQFGWVACGCSGAGVGALTSGDWLPVSGN